MRSVLLLTILALSGASHDVRPAVYRLTVEAGPYDRQHTVVAFTLPEAGSNYRLLDAEGRSIPLQRGADGQARFVLDTLAAGTAATYRLETIDHAPPAPAGVVAREEAGTVTLALDGRPVLAYHARPTPLPRADIPPIYRRGGYIHPVFTPAGTLVTDDYPPNHLHHHGIWAAWTKTQFQGRAPDFWNMGDGTGTVEPVALDSTWSGPVHAGFRSRHRYVDLSAPEPVTVLEETWTVHVYDVVGTGRPYYLFDLELVQHNVTADPLVLPTYLYGGVGFRGHRRWNGADSTFFLTSEGRDRSDGHGTRARWCHISGFVDGRQAGIAILGHPGNDRAPQPMRIHPNEPFFNFAPSQAGDGSIEPGRPYAARYRFVTTDGPPDVPLLERLWNDYAYPPRVRVEVLAMSNEE